MAGEGDQEARVVLRPPGKLDRLLAHPYYARWGGVLTFLGTYGIVSTAGGILLHAFAKAPASLTVLFVIACFCALSGATLSGLSRRARSRLAASSLPIGNTPAERQELAGECDKLAADLKDFLDARAAQNPAQPDPLARTQVPKTPANVRAIAERRQEVIAYRRETLAQYYLTFRQRALDLFDHAVVLHLVPVGERMRIDKPDDRLGTLPNLFRIVAVRLRAGSGLHDGL